MLRRVLPAALLALLTTCSGEAKKTTPVGVLLPLTGALADSGAQGQSAILMVAEQVNQAGGLGGQPISLFLRDTRGSLTFGLEGARRMLDHGVVGIIGPEETDLAMDLVTLVREREIPVISGGVTSPLLATEQDSGFFFRTCPSALLTGSAVAQRMRQDGITRAAFLYSPDDAGSAFIARASVSFADGGEIVAPGNPGPISVLPATDYRELLGRLHALQPQALLLAADPVSSALIVQQWRLLGGAGRIYLGPGLMSDVFVQQLPPGAERGMVGVSALSSQDFATFAQEFETVAGEPASQSAFFYYDAMALLALAYERAAREAGPSPTGAQVRDALGPVAGPPGETVRWNELARGLELVRQGTEIDYLGASGESDWAPNGDLAASQTRFWRVEDRRIVLEQ